MPRSLIDTSVLVATIDVTDPYHQLCIETAARYPDFLVPAVMLTEADYLIRKYVGDTTVLYDQLAKTRPPLVDLVHADLQRVQAIRQKYRTAKLDFVDCCIMAMAERLNITHICTLDRRDFSIFQRTEGGYLTLLPERLPG